MAFARNKLSSSSFPFNVDFISLGCATVLIFLITKKSREGLKSSVYNRTMFALSVYAIITAVNNLISMSIFDKEMKSTLISNLVGGIDYFGYMGFIMESSWLCLYFFIKIRYFLNDDSIPKYLEFFGVHGFIVLYSIRMASKAIHYNLIEPNTMLKTWDIPWKPQCFEQDSVYYEGGICSDYRSLISVTEVFDQNIPVLFLFLIIYTTYRDEQKVRPNPGTLDEDSEASQDSLQATRGIALQAFVYIVFILASLYPIQGVFLLAIYCWYQVTDIKRSNPDIDTLIALKQLFTTIDNVEADEATGEKSKLLMDGLAIVDEEFNYKSYQRIGEMLHLDANNEDNDDDEDDDEQHRFHAYGEDNIGADDIFLTEQDQFDIDVKLDDAINRVMARRKHRDVGNNNNSLQEQSSFGRYKDEMDDISSQQLSYMSRDLPAVGKHKDEMEDVSSQQLSYMSRDFDGFSQSGLSGFTDFTRSVVGKDNIGTSDQDNFSRQMSQEEQHRDFHSSPPSHHKNGGNDTQN
ncbi:predicted protein [Chaetoceros tenuissimus]|uniref:Uncharacterized protein n=1 Tax=Chaetoceros tenuissimus TaxID=426638 RepID=A0AAD3D8J9_9STRA|nr:predicted protein [Chaetoceros tenuissimus]